MCWQKPTAILLPPKNTVKARAQCFIPETLPFPCVETARWLVALRKGERWKIDVPVVPVFLLYTWISVGGLTLAAGVWMRTGGSRQGLGVEQRGSNRSVELPSSVSCSAVRPGLVLLPRVHGGCSVLRAHLPVAGGGAGGTAFPAHPAAAAEQLRRCRCPRGCP